MNLYREEEEERVNWGESCLLHIHVSNLVGFHTRNRVVLPFFFFFFFFYHFFKF